MKKRATITFERERLLVIRRSSRGLQEWCASCQNDVDFVGVEEAAVLMGTTQRKVFCLAETGLIHLLETAEGRALFCARSLTKIEQ